MTKTYGTRKRSTTRIKLKFAESKLVTTIANETTSKNGNDSLSKNENETVSKNLNETSTQVYPKCVDTVSRFCDVVPDTKDFTQIVQINALNKVNQEVSKIERSFSKETYQDHSQLTSPSEIADKNRNLLPETLQQLQELKKLLCCEKARVENSSQYINTASSDRPTYKYIETDDGAKWRSVEDISEIDKLIEQNSDISKGIYISDVPRVRVIAERYSKFRKENVELRKIEEKIVCVEYDVYSNKVSSESEASMPSEQLRAFFIVKPTQMLETQDGNEGLDINSIPSNVKQKYNISNTDNIRTDAEEIEIIDGQLIENRPYLDNLKALLKRRRIMHAKRKRSSLDLHELYEVAKRNKLILQDDNVITKGEVKEIKHYILNKTNSNVSGIVRRTIAKKQVNEAMPIQFSQIIVNELLRGKKQ